MEVCKREGLPVQKLAVDDSEFPFLVYGVVSGEHEFQALANGLRSMEDYGYGGSVVGTTDEHSTYFSLNMIPLSRFPSDQIAACHRRLMIRLQMLADKAQKSK